MESVPAPSPIPDLPAWCKRTEVGLIIEKKKRPTFEEWAGAFEVIHKTAKGHQWQIGDMLNEGEDWFGEDYAQVIDPLEEQQREDEDIGETYRSYQWVAKKIPVVHRCTDVPWSLHRDVASMEPEERDHWLAEAAARKLSRRQLREEVKAAKLTVQSKAKRQNDFKVFLERVDKIILDDFMATCPNAEWGRRVFKSWRDDLLWELHLIQRLEVADKVTEALGEGAVTVADIKSKTGLTVKEIEGVIAGKVAEGTWEMVREGGETDMSRGTRRMIIHVVGEACFA